MVGDVAGPTGHGGNADAGVADCLQDGHEVAEGVGEAGGQGIAEAGPRDGGIHRQLEESGEGGRAARVGSRPLPRGPLVRDVTEARREDVALDRVLEFEDALLAEERARLDLDPGRAIDMVFAGRGRAHQASGGALGPVHGRHESVVRP